MALRETLHPWVHRLVTSRLVHFALLGAALFLVAPAERANRPVRIEASRVERGFRKEQSRLGRVLSPLEKQKVMRELVDEELLYREGRRLALDETDPIVRGRVAETMRRSLGQIVTDAKLDAIAIDRRADEIAARAAARVRLELWFVSRDRPDAARVADALVTSGAKSPDLPPLPEDAFYGREALERLAGEAVAEAAFTTTLGERSAPVNSAWGFWLVRPVERRAITAGEARALAIDEARARASAAMVAGAIARSEQEHDVHVDVPASEPDWDPHTPREVP